MILDIKPSRVVTSTGMVGTLARRLLLTLRMAWEAAREYGHDYLGTKSTFYTVSCDKVMPERQRYREMGINVDMIISELKVV